MLILHGNGYVRLDYQESVKFKNIEQAVLEPGLPFFLTF